MFPMLLSNCFCWFPFQTVIIYLTCCAYCGLDGFLFLFLDIDLLLGNWFRLGLPGSPPKSLAMVVETASYAGL